MVGAIEKKDWSENWLLETKTLFNELCETDVRNKVIHFEKRKDWLEGLMSKEREINLKLSVLKKCIGDFFCSCKYYIDY